MGALSDAKVHATVAVTDLQRAKSFYRDTLGLREARDEGDAATVLECGGTQLIIYPSSFAGTCQSTVATFEVTDLDAVMAGLRANGVTFEEYAMREGLQTKDGVAEGMGLRSAWFKDPDGNTVGLVSRA